MMRKFKRIDLTNATEDYFLRVGEEAYISFSDVTQVPLHIATQDGTYYEMHIIAGNVGGTSGAALGYIFLCPNNQTYSNAFYSALMWRSGSSHSSSYIYKSGFVLASYYSNILTWITNRTQYKNTRSFLDLYGYSDTYPNVRFTSSDWRDTTTEWTSLGTVSFPQSTSGEILVRRLK